MSRNECERCFNFKMCRDLLLGLYILMLGFYDGNERQMFERSTDPKFLMQVKVYLVMLIGPRLVT